MDFMRLLFAFVLPAVLSAQLIPVGQRIPKGPNPPVVFVNGYQTTCTGSDLASNFGAPDQVLQANSIVTLYFDNCSIGSIGPARPSLEAEGIAFGKFLAALKYTDGTPVAQVDVVAHSMGGLIVRSYLAGKQDVSPAAFNPPAVVPIRRAIFLATPHFGTMVASLLSGIGVPNDAQTSEMQLGSQFLFDLNSWNQGSDDLRGIQAIAVAGNGGTGDESNSSGSFDDGVVALTSASLGFYRTGVTRVLPYCHTANSLLQLAGYCSGSTPVVNNITTDPNNPVSQILVSFLTGTTAWQSVGKAIQDVSTAASTAGLQIQLRDQNDVVLPVVSASATSLQPAASIPVNSDTGVAYTEAIAAAAPLTLQVAPRSGSPQSTTITAPVTTELAAVVKPGPMISPKGVIPAAGPAPFPYDVAAGAYVSIYGSNLAGGTQTAAIPYPPQLGDVQVLVNGTPAQIVFISASQINFVYPTVSGLTQLTVKNSSGQNTVNVRVAPATPSIFLLDAASDAAAVDVTTGQVVGAGAPLQAGDFVSVYVTGLGATTNMSGLDYAQLQPTVTIGGVNVTVQYAGRTPGFAGLDQINCQVPAGITGAAVPVVVSSAGRVSNTAFLNIR